MPEVVLLTLVDQPARCGDACGCGHDTPAARVPVLTCCDTLRNHGATVTPISASSDHEIDTAVKSAEATGARLIVGASCDGEVRAVLRRMVRHHAPPPSQRPAALPPGRTVFDLPPLAILPLLPAVPDLVRRLDLPTTAEEVATAVLAGRTRRFDLLRNDGGSVTVASALLGGVDAKGAAAVWQARIEVDDAVLASGAEPVVACAIGNAAATELDGLPLLPQVDPADGLLNVAVAVPIVRTRTLRRAQVRFEVRRARGRAVSVTPPPGADLHLIDDGVAGTLTRKRSWWIEPKVWAAYTISPADPA